MELRAIIHSPIEDDAAPADPITIADDTESDCDLQQKEVNLEDIEKMKVEEDDSDSEDEGSLSQPFHKSRPGPFELRLSQTMIHNHGPSTYIILLPSSDTGDRQRSRKNQALVAKLSDPPARVLNLFINREHGVIMKSEDIYNLLWRCVLAERRVMNQAERA
ncbi:hypothetical protein E4U27_008074 [Claviceps purpurea]|nr:hypothetical protein E4U27_008074 [Claviceps purpurea]KAG6261889.1 hypothetical protein E4U49_003533 [Claviceps purpurea]